MPKKPEWKKTHEFMIVENPAVNRWRPHIPKDSLIMDSNWQQEKPVKRFDFLDHVEVKYISWVDYNIDGTSENLKQLVRSPADPRNPGESVWGHVVGMKQILSGYMNPGYSHQDYWGEWDCESAWFEQHARYFVYEVKHDLHHPPMFVLPEDMVKIKPAKKKGPFDLMTQDDVYLRDKELPKS